LIIEAERRERDAAWLLCSSRASYQRAISDDKPCEETNLAAEKQRTFALPSPAQKLWGGSEQWGGPPKNVSKLETATGVWITAAPSATWTASLSWVQNWERRGYPL